MMSSSVPTVVDPYNSKPPRADLLTDIIKVADRAGWNNYVIVQQLALFIANETDRGVDLIKFLEAQEKEEESNLIA